MPDILGFCPEGGTKKFKKVYNNFLLCIPILLWYNFKYID